MVAATQELPFVTCLCPTFHRPKLLANALACFLAQDYPTDRRELIIVDDGCDFADTNSGAGGFWKIISHPERFASLPDKFNYCVEFSPVETDIFVVWEDDDIYLPHHISTHVEALTRDPHRRGYSKPSFILSTYTGNVRTEEATGRFHASIAFTRESIEKTHGWPLSKRADFDQEFMSRLANVNLGAVDPCTIAPPSYVFRFGSTQAYHGQHFMRSPEDESWYDRVPHTPGQRNLILLPEFDEETKSVYALHSV